MTLRSDLAHLPLRARLVVLNAATTTPVSPTRRRYGVFLVVFNLAGWSALALYLGN